VTLAVILACGYRWSRKPQGFELNHVTLFSLGAALYWISPIVLGGLRPFAGEPAVGVWYAFFDSHTSLHRLVVYCAVIIGFQFAFVYGSWVGSHLRIPVPFAQVLPFERRYLAFLFLPVLVIALLYGVQLRNEFFSGYIARSENDLALRGPFTASTLALLNIAFLYAATRPLSSEKRWWANAYVAAFSIVAVLLLSLGGRLYVASALLMALVYYSTKVRPISRKSLLIGGAVTVAGAGMAGLVRVGGTVSLKGALINIASEPLFTSFSLLQFLSQSHFELWNSPKFLLSSLINLIPTGLLPGKAQYLLDPTAYGYVVYQPFGGLNSFFSLSINFGILGSLIPLFLLGLLLSVLRRQRAAPLQVMYCMLSGWLGFSFFRDDFSISIVKNMLEFSVLVPIGIAGLLHIVTIAAAANSAELVSQ
jgi:oligosaccharide repeat unit polymerase